jgi:outer membrane biogenesis lipoprotein LolB
MTRTCLPMAILLLAACSSHASKEDKLNAAANQSTPEAANVLAGAAENGMNAQTAMNEAAQAQASNTSAASATRYQARPNSAKNPNPPKAGEPPQKVSVNSQ